MLAEARMAHLAADLESQSLGAGADKAKLMLALGGNI
jgi:hypothetical protein